MNILVLLINLIIILSILTLFKNIISPTEGETYQDLHKDILNYIHEEVIGNNQNELDVRDRLIKISIYASLFLIYSIVYPIYLWIQYLESKNN